MYDDALRLRLARIIIHNSALQKVKIQKLRSPGKAEPQRVGPIVRGIDVALGAPAVPGIAVPTAAAIHPPRAR